MLLGGFVSDLIARIYAGRRAPSATVMLIRRTGNLPLFRRLNPIAWYPPGTLADSDDKADRGGFLKNHAVASR